MNNDWEHKLAIQELVFKYCRAVDRRDFASLAKLYAEDSWDDHGAMFQGTGGDFVKWLPAVLDSMQMTSHTVTNHLISIEGDKAEGEVYCTAYHLTVDDQEVIIGGRYLDQYIYEQRRWVFKHRKIVMDWNQIKPSSCDMSSPIVKGVDVGTCFDADPSAAFFKFLQVD